MVGMVAPQLSGNQNNIGRFPLETRSLECQNGFQRGQENKNPQKKRAF